MKISELISKLEEFQNKHGDIPVECKNFAGEYDGVRHAYLSIRQYGPEYSRKVVALTDEG